MDIKVKHPETKREIVVQFDLPNKLEDLRKRFGDEVVANHAVAAIKVSVQGVVRNALAADDPAKTPKQIQDIVTAYKPGVRVRGKTPQEKIAEGFQKLNPDQKRALLKQLAG